MKENLMKKGKENDLSWMSLIQFPWFAKVLSISTFDSSLVSIFEVPFNLLVIMGDVIPPKL